MKAPDFLSCIQILFSLYALVKCDAKAGFLNNIPVLLDSESIPDYDDYPLHDSDVKIPGRHIPKRPYLNPFLEGDDSSSESTISEYANYKNQRYSNYADIQELPQGDGLKTPVGPHFDRNLTRNVTVQAGKQALLSCRVEELSQKSVSWIRLRDLHILSVDKYKYSTDQRISVSYNESQKEWVLRIRGAKHSDAGKYECQVSTKPVLSFIVNLEVVVPNAYIINSPDIHVHIGSLINLTCVVSHDKNQLVYIYWHHQNKIVDIGVGNSRKTVEMLTDSKDRTISQLLVRRARFQDSGKYTCKPSNGNGAYVNIHVLKGELQAAMQTNGASGAYLVPLLFFVALIDIR